MVMKNRSVTQILFQHLLIKIMNDLLHHVISLLRVFNLITGKYNVGLNQTSDYLHLKTLTLENGAKFQSH